MRRLEIGVALSEEIFAAYWSGGSKREMVPLAGATADAIRDASLEVNRLVGARRRIVVSVALLPPLVQMRRLELPRMSADDYRLAVTTNAQRFFLDAGQDVVCGAAVTGAGKRRSVSLMAFAARSELIERLSRGFESAGWAVDRIVPAHGAWVASVIHEHPSARRGLARIVVRLPSELSVLEVDRGRLDRVRRFRHPADLSPLAPGRRTFNLDGDGSDRSAVMVAAAGAGLVRGFEILPERSRRARAARQRRISAIFVALACVNVFGAAAAYRWRLERQLTAVAAQRSAIHVAALQAVELQDSVRRLSERIASLLVLERTAPRWSAVLSRIAIAIPDDAKLSSIRAESDSVVIDGDGPDASSVLAALRGASGIKGTKAVSPISREPSPDRVAVERWRFALRVDHHAATRH